jgi:membrane protein implicated in regulation of membrane protease activity
MLAWFIGQIYFWQFLLLFIAAIFIGYGFSAFSLYLRKNAVKKARMKDKQVINDIGAYIGKVIKVQPIKGTITIKTDHGTIVTYDVDRIANIADRVIIK